MSFIVLVFKFISFIYLSSFFLHGMRQQSISLFCLWIFIRGTICWNTVISICLGIPQKSIYHKWRALFLDSVLSYWSMFTFTRASCSLDYCFFVVTCEIRKCESFNFVLFSRMSWLFWVPCNSMWALESFHQFPGRKKKKGS